MAVYGGISWRGDSGSPTTHETLTLVRSLGSLTNPIADIRDFRIAMLSHSECNAPYYIYVVSVYRTPAGAPGVGANINKKGIIYYRDPVDQGVYHLDYPCPISAEVESTPTGNIIKSTAVVDIVGHLSVAMNKTLTPLYGSFVQRI